MKHCYALRHVPFESLGLIEPLLMARGFNVHCIDVPVTDLSSAPLGDADLVIVLGGPISAYEEHLYPFLNAELKLLEGRLRADRATLGICLGAQLMARALGARVYPGTAKEIGWSALHLSEHGKASPLGAIADQRVLHWHGDTFDLPSGATWLASTDVTPHQAFAWHDSAFALQFHLEVTVGELEAWYVGHTLELSRLTDTNVQTLRAEGQRYAPMLKPFANRALAGMLDRIARPAEP